MTTQAAHIELPQEVVYSNRWTGFRNKEIAELFECIPPEELAKLEPGTVIWVDSEHPQGKVYGYDRAEVVSVSDNKTDVGVMFKGPQVSGGTTVKKNAGWHKVHRCTDPAGLVELIKQFPLAIEGGTVGTMSDASHEYLKSIGAVIVPA